MESGILEFDDDDESLEGLIPQEDDVLHKTITTMEEAQLCFHPVHHHSFAPVNFLLSGSMRKCVGCQQRLKAGVVVGDASVVKCVSCGSYAHRSCAMDTPSRPQDFALMWNTKCPVNTVIMNSLEGSPTVGEEENDEVLVSVEASTEESTQQDDNSLIPQLHKEDSGEMVEKDDSSAEQQQQQSSSSSIFQFLSPSHLFVSAAPSCESAPKELTESSDDDDDDDEVLVWTSDGPPRHWASQEVLSGIHRSDETDNNQEDTKTPLHVANNTFATVSRALQENIVAHFVRRPFIEKVISTDASSDVGSTNVALGEPPQSPVPTIAESTIIDRTRTADSTVSQAQVKALLTEVEPSSPKRSSIAKMASGSIKVAKTSAAMRKKMGIVSVAGGIAGGVAGLVMAGPAGAVIGAKCGQTAGLLGVLVEGSLSVGVIVAGVAAGSFTAQHIQQQKEKRVLTIGEDGVKQKLLLVRPNVSIDPVWEEICKKARRNHASSSSMVFGLLPSTQGSLTKKERQKRDSDIVETDESEIPTVDKVLLLVSRSLNNKQSLPGYLYKDLIQEYRKRCQSREERKKLESLGSEDGQSETEMVGVDEEKDVPDPFESVGNEAKDDQDDVEAENDKDCSSYEMRARRQDTHAVIKHVTATLLEVRPGFAASPAVTEMSATAVEGLVFGELYDSVFEEIAEETRDSDTALMNKIRDFESHVDNTDTNGMISQPAIDALLMLPDAHSSADKLRYCVQFLELISVHFSELSKKRPNAKPSSLSADSLLKMVCQHLIVAKVPLINAEILFLEEFARDEQLLRGKEGYALVTLQASLHFLNTSTNFVEDIFGQDEE